MQICWLVGIRVKRALIETCANYTVLFSSIGEYLLFAPAIVTDNYLIAFHTNLMHKEEKAFDIYEFFFRTKFYIDIDKKLPAKLYIERLKNLTSLYMEYCG